MKFLLIFAATLRLFLLEETEARAVEEPHHSNGSTVDSSRLKYVVSIQKIINDKMESEHICSGAIIDKFYVLTAAHCVLGLVSGQLLVRTGQLDDSNTPVTYNVAKYMYLETYHNSSCRSHENDIAILKMDTGFNMANDFMYQKVHLPEYDIDYENRAVTFSGFGAEKIEITINLSSNQSSSAFKYPDHLKFFDSTVLSLEECKNIMPMTVTNAHICTNPETANGISCIGDGGGPLVYSDSNGDTVVGIRTQHKECLEEFPEVFTRVSSYLWFIDHVLQHTFSYDIATVY